jgi:hypothetical protein
VQLPGGCRGVADCRAWLSIDMPEILCQLSVLEVPRFAQRTSSSIGGLVDSDEAMTEFKRVVSKSKDD